MSSKFSFALRKGIAKELKWHMSERCGVANWCSMLVLHYETAPVHNKASRYAERMRCTQNYASFLIRKTDRIETIGSFMVYYLPRKN